MDYDVLVLGGGMIGCAVAYELSKYNLNIAVIEKDYDIGADAALINSATVYDGLECSDSVSSSLIRKGNLMFDEYTEKFNVPFKRMGSLYVAKDEEQSIYIKNMYERAKLKNISDVRFLKGDEIFQFEPNLDRDVKEAVYLPNTGVVCSYDLVLAYGEIAFDNGVKFRLEEEVLSIEKISKGFRVETSRNKFTCKIVINTTAEKHLGEDLNSNFIEDAVKNNLKYIMVNKNYRNSYSNIIFDVDSKERRYIRPTMDGNIIGAVSTKKNISYNKVIDKLSSILGSFDSHKVKMVLDWTLYDEPVVIDDSISEDGYLNVVVKHFGKVTMTPAIAEIVCKIVVNNFNCILKKDFIDRRREYYKFKDLSNVERNNIIKLDENYGKLVCLCEGITEGEIVDAIRRPLGARTLEGVRRRTSAGLGNCRGAYCNQIITDILARETNKSMLDIDKNTKSSKIVLNRIKEFDTM
ncbi:NAD(P)/FAD-dependent oxidoreductase [Clostridium senegalense]|uniref:FAD-dependent oxidoreductase n=1 Tax=Clostridium senegalense TaxID=1465809 RepID=A0A6M0H6A7_9CLOT|nr:FAD-dependent oxidoreductase [Clostridium senegalense]NEU06266.1 FAD-dependent oxidoreductase [Clostridium senegalense]